MFCGIACLLLANSIELLCTMTIKSENQCTMTIKSIKPKVFNPPLNAMYIANRSLHCIANSF